MTGTLTITTRLLTGELKNGLKKLSNTAKDVGNSFKANLQSFLKMAVVLGTIVALIKIITGAFNVLKDRNDELFKKIELIKTALGNIATAIFTGVANILGPILNKLADWILTLLGYINTIVVAFGGMDLFSKNTAKNMKNTAKASKEIKKQLAGFDEMNILSDSGPSGGAGALGGGSSLNPPAINENLFKVVTNFKNMWEEILKIDQNEARKLLIESDRNWGLFKAGIFDITQGIVKMFDGLLKGDFKQVGNGFIQLVRGIVETAVGTFNGLFNSISSVGEKIGKTVRDKVTTIFNGIKTSVSSIIDKIKAVFTNLKSHIVDIFNGIKNALKSPINIIIGWINKLISGLNKISIDIPSWVPTYGGKKWGFNISTIPKLAQGGIVNNPGMGVNIGGAIAGERGAEAVLPLTDDTLQRLASMIPITINLTNSMNGRVLNREIQKINAQNIFAGNR